jgi:hypothetical protein
MDKYEVVVLEGVGSFQKEIHEMYKKGYLLQTTNTLFSQSIPIEGG